MVRLAAELLLLLGLLLLTLHITVLRGSGAADAPDAAAGNATGTAVQVSAPPGRARAREAGCGAGAGASRGRPPPRPAELPLSAQRFCGGAWRPETTSRSARSSPPVCHRPGSWWVRSLGRAEEVWSPYLLWGASSLRLPFGG